MNSDNDSLHQPNSIQQKPISSFKPLNPLALLAVVLSIAAVVGASGYLLGIRNSQFVPASQPSPTIIKQDSNLPFSKDDIARSLNKHKDAINCIKDVLTPTIIPVITQLANCKEFTGVERTNCEKKLLGEFDNAQKEKMKKLDECYIKYPSSFPTGYQPGENNFVSTFDKLQAVRKRAAETEKNSACIYVNFYFRKYRDDFGEYPKSLSDMVPKYFQELPQNATYERETPDKFKYSITLSTGEVFTLTQNDTLDDYEPTLLNERCREWSKRYSPQ